MNPFIQPQQGALQEQANGPMPQQAMPQGPMNAAPQMQPQGNPLMQQQPGMQFRPQNQMQPPPSLEQVNMAIDHNKAIAGAMAGVLGNQNAGSKDVLTMITDLMRQGIVQPQKAAALASELPTDPQQIRSWLMQHFMANMQAGRALNQHLATRNG